MRRAPLALLGLAILLLQGIAAWAQPLVVDHALVASKGLGARFDGRETYVVQLDGPASEARVAQMLAAAGAAVTPLHAVPAVVATAPWDALDLVVRDPGVRTLSAAVTGTSFVDDPCAAPGTAAPAAPWWLADVTGLQDQSSSWDGTGTVVAFVDTGVDATHADLASSFLGNARPGDATWLSETSFDAVTGTVHAPLDACGHGTAVAGIVSSSQVGAARGAKWISARVGQSAPTDANVYLAYDWILQLPPETRPQVVVNSWGFEALPTQPTMLGYLAALKQANILSVYAAGNANGPSTLALPADYPEAFAVSGVDPAGNQVGATGPSKYGEGGVLLDASARVNPKPDVVAPAIQMASTWPGGGYAEFDGASTSLAAPLAAAAALMTKQSHPWLSASELELSLKGGASQRGWASQDATRPNDVVGWGIVDAPRTVDLPAATAGTVVAVGDVNSVWWSRLTQAGLQVLRYPGNDAGMESAREGLDGAAVLLLGAVDTAMSRTLDQLVARADAAHVGVVYLGVPAQPDQSVDALSRYLASHGTSYSAFQATTQLTGKLVANPILPSTHKAGDVVPLQGYADSSSHVYDTFSLPGSLSPSTVLVPGAAGATGALAQAVTSDGNRRFLLADAEPPADGSSTVADPLTPVVLEAAAWARLAHYDLPATDNGRVAALTAPILLVGDHDHRIGALLDAARASYASVEARDTATLLASLQAEAARESSGLPDRVRLVIYDDLRPSGAPSARQQVAQGLEDARRSTNVEAIVLGSAQQGALDLLAQPDGYTVGLAQPSKQLVATAPHAVNDHANAGATVSLATAPRVFSASGWTEIYEASGQTAAATTSDGRLTVLGFGAAPGVGADEAAAAIVARAIAWKLPLQRLSADLHLETNAQVQAALDAFPGNVRLASPTQLVVDRVNPYQTTIYVGDVDFDVTIQNSEFDGVDQQGPVPPTTPTPGVAGLVVRGATRDVLVTGNAFRDEDPAILVAGSPRVHVHFNQFNHNYWALRRADAQAAADRTDATHNYLLQLLDVSPQVVPGTPWFDAAISTIGQSRRNAVDAGFDVLPYCRDPACADQFPILGRDYLPDAGSVLLGLRETAEPDNLMLLSTTGSDLALQSLRADGSVAQDAVPLSGPAGTARQLLVPATGTSLAVTARSGYGESTLVRVPTSMPRDQLSVLRSDFAQGAAGWTLQGAARSAQAGADGAAGYLAIPAGASASTSVSMPLASRSLLAYLRTHAAGDAGTLDLTWGDASLPLTSLTIRSGQLVDPFGNVVATRFAPGSWHRVEARLDLPDLDVVVDNGALARVPAVSWPPEESTAYALGATLRATSGTLDADNLDVYRGEPLAARIVGEDFQDGAGNVQVSSGSSGSSAILDGGGATSGAPQTNILYLQAAPASSSSPSQSQQVAPVSLAQFAQPGGSAAFANGRSLFVQNDGSSPEPAVSMALPGGLTRYSFTEYVSLPGATRFSRFPLLTLSDAAGTTLLSLQLENDNLYLDAQGAEHAPDFAALPSGQWHMLSVLVEGPTYTVLVDSAPALRGHLAASQPVATWSAASGAGSAIFANLAFGYYDLFDSALSRLDLASEGWRLHATSASGGVSRATSIPALTPTQAADPPLVSSGMVHVAAPASESSVSYLERPLEMAPGGAFDVSYEVYLPALNPVFRSDAFELGALDNNTTAARTPRYALCLCDGDDRLDIMQGAQVVTSSSFPTLTRERWYTIHLRALGDGSVQAWFNGAQLPGVGPGAVPNLLALGDEVGKLNPLTTGQVGSGEVYADDFNARKSDAAPAVTLDPPPDPSSGIVSFTGHASDPDPEDGVQSVTVSIWNGASRLASWPAEGTTSWSATWNSTSLPQGAYSLHANATDGRKTSANATATLNVDNRPTGGIASPPAGRVGGIVTLQGTAAPRAPIYVNETVRSVNWTVGNGAAWSPAQVSGTNWSATWDTRSAPAGATTLKVDASEWLDTVEWQRSLVVDQSPTVTVTQPAQNAATGGYVNVTGTLTDNYPLPDDWDAPHAALRVDGGAWTNLTLVPQPGGGWSWTLRLNTLPLSTGSHAIEVRGTKYASQSSVVRTISVSNAPLLTVASPTSPARARDLLRVMGNATARWPSAEAPFVEGVTVQLDGGPEQPAPLTNLTNGTSTWTFTLNTSNAPDGAHTITVRARDGAGTTTTVLSIAFVNRNADLPDGRTYDALRAGETHAFTLNVSTGATQLTLHAHMLVPDTALALYLTQVATGKTWTGVGFGDATVSITPLDGLIGGAYTLQVYGYMATDYRVDRATTGTGVGGGLP